MEMRFEEFLDDPKYWNYQSQSLTQDARWVEEWTGQLPNLGQGSDDFMIVENTFRLYERAASRLRKLDHVGNTADLESTLKVVFDWLGMPKPAGRVIKRNVGIPRPALSRTITRKIEERHSADARLFGEFAL